MSKFYVNSIANKKLLGFENFPYGRMLIGLFKQCKSEGRGSFCGYYGAEYYLDTELYAYYIADGPIYIPECRISEVKICEPIKVYLEIQIGSHMWTKVIEAETVEEAIGFFNDAKWRDWYSSKDEIR